MHYSLKSKRLCLWLLALSLLLPALSGCTGGVTTKTIDKSYETDTVTVDAKIPQFFGLSSDSLEASVNDEIENFVSSHLSDFKESAKKTGDKSLFTLTTTEYFNQAGFFSVVIEANSSVGSAQKNSFRITKNIDLENSKVLAFCDLFEDDSYIDMINERLNEVLKNNPEKYMGLWEKPKIIQNQEFYIDGENLVLYYPPYELSYYERGFVEIPLSLSDMMGYLKPEYRKLILDKS